MARGSKASSTGQRVDVDYNRSWGGAALGARLRRLSERIDREAAAVYTREGVHFEQRWMGVLRLLSEREGLSVKDIAEALVITHPSVSQTRRSLQDAGLITDRPDPNDARRRILELTEAGAAFVARVRPIWLALMEVAEDLDREAQDVITPLNRLDDALERRSLFDRTLDKLSRGGIKME